MNNDALIRESLLYKNRGNHEEATCRTLTADMEIKGCEWVPLEEIGNMKRAMLPIALDSSGKTLFTGFAHTTVIGSTGTGKSEVIIKNTIQLFSKMNDRVKPSFVAADLKGDISRQLYSHLVDNGYRVLVLDMKRPYQSARYNFMTQMYEDYQEIVRLKKVLEDKKFTAVFEGVEYSSTEEVENAINARIMTLNDNIERTVTELSTIIIPGTDPKDLSWVQGARTMLCAVILTMLHDSTDSKTGMSKKKFTISNVCRAAFHTDDDCDDIVEWLKRADYNLTVSNAITGNYHISARATRDGYISTLNTALNAYTSNAVAALTVTNNDMKLREIATREKPYAIFLITDDQQKVTNSIAMMFINDLVAELSSYADTVGVGGLTRDFVFLLDEFANMPAMPDMSNKITTLRSRRIWMVMAIQSIQQLNKVYGDETAEIIRDNCDLSFFLGSNNLATKEVFADSMGKRAGISTSYQKGNDGNTSESVTTGNIPVIRISDLDKLKLGEFYVRARTFVNLKSYMVPYFLRKESQAVEEYLEGEFRDFDPDANLYKLDEVLAKIRGRRSKYSFDW